MTLNQRQLMLLEEIMYSQNIAISDISLTYNVSRQTIYEDVGNINFWLSSHQLGKILILDGFLSLQLNNVENLRQILSVQDLSVDLLNREARQSFILFNLLENPSITLDFLNEKIPVSKSTLVNDMKYLKAHLKAQDVHLLYERPNYQFIGDEQTIRIAILNALIPYIQYFITFDKVYKYLPFLQKSRGLCGISKMSLDILSLALYITEVRVSFGMCVVYENLDEHTITKEEAILVLEIQYFVSNIEFSTGEQFYLIQILHCFGRFEANPTFEAKIKLLANQIVMHVQLLSTDAVDTKVLQPKVYEHVRSMYFRMYLGLILFNTTISSIKKKYGYLYFCSQKILKSAIPFAVSEEVLMHEASYLSILLQTQLPQKRLVAKALIVCYQGISVSKLLRQQIEQLGVPIQIIAETSADRIADFPQVDIIISTTPLNIKDSLILYVNPILTELDYKKITSILSSGTLHEQLQDKLFQVMKSHVTEEQFSNIMQDFLYLTPIKKYKGIHERGEVMLVDLLTEEFIQYEESVNSWEEAIELVAKPLLEGEYITHGYVDKIIENVKQQGEYIMLREGFALPHARPEDGVNQIGMSFLKLEKPIFLNNKQDKPVQVFVMLAAQDAQKHLSALSELVEYIAEDEDFDKILETQSVADLVCLIQDKSNK